MVPSSLKNSVNRRFVLGSILTLSVPMAGCMADNYQNSVRIDLEPISDSEITRRVVPQLDEFEDPRRTAYIEAIQTGRATLVVDSTSQSPRMVYNDRVYEIRVTEEQVVNLYNIQLSFSQVDIIKEASDYDIVRYGSLPEVDRNKLREVGYGPENPNYGAGVRLTYTETESEQSLLAPEPTMDVVTWPESETATLDLVSTSTGQRFTQVLEPEVVSDNLSRYGSNLRQSYQYVFNDLTEEERRILEQAVSESYTWNSTNSPSDAIERLAERFDEATPIVGHPSSQSGSFIILFEDTIYWAEAAFNLIESD